MTSPNSVPKGVLTISAGPVYVEFSTSITHPPSRVIHAEFFAEGMKPGAKSAPPWKRRIGGSVWKAIQYKRNAVHQSKASDGASPDKIVFVSRVAPVCTRTGDAWKRTPFVDDGRWLRNQIETEAGDKKFRDGPAADYLHLALESAGPLATSDYTFHIQHRVWHPWPVMTICGGAALQLTWDDVLNEWVDKWQKEQIRFKETIIFLSGVLRTRLLPTLAEAIRNEDERTAELLANAKLVIDFGRTSRRDDDPDKETRKYQKEFGELVQQCVRAADVVLADEHTASDFGFRDFDNLPQHRLVVRRITPTSEIWWQFRKGKRRNQGFTELGHFEAPKLNLPEQIDSDDSAKPAGRRPARDIRLATALCLRNRTYEPGKWQRYVDPRTTRRPEELTEIPELADELKRLEKLLQREVISTLFLYGETGTGKEVVAEWVHRIHPSFSEGVFHAVSCGRQRGELVQSELFGHVAGAFTGATGNRKGAFAQADGGVLLLDDLDALDVRTQSMLLRVIETGLVRPVGSEFEQRVEVFLIVTTNVHPEELLQRPGDTRLREDLYYRFLAGGEALYLPPLRGRSREILRVARRIWNEQNERFETDFPFPNALGPALKKSTLPGNYRGLIACVLKTYRTTLAVFECGETIAKTGIPLPEHIKDWLRAESSETGERKPSGRRRRRTPNEEFLESLNEADRLDDLAAEKAPAKRLGLFCRMWNAWCDERVELGFDAAECRLLSGKRIRDILAFDPAQFQKAATALEESNVFPRIRVAAGMERRSHYCELIVA